mgnify:CR=1 FL=1
MSIARCCILGSFLEGLTMVSKSLMQGGRSFSRFFLTTIVRISSLSLSFGNISLTFCIVVLTKPRERDGVTKYIVYKRVSFHFSFLRSACKHIEKPIPLDLLVLTNFTDPPVQRNVGILWPNARQSEIDRALYPMIIQHNGRNATVPITLYTETERARAEWKMRLEEALGLRAVVSESNRVFEIETLSIETFLIPPLNLAAVTPGWHDVNTFTGKVTCSVPFSALSFGSVCLRF